MRNRMEAMAVMGMVEISEEMVVTDVMPDFSMASAMICALDQGVRARGWMDISGCFS